MPFLAALLYKLFGVHEVFGRLLSIGFGVATIPLIALFGRWLFAPGAAPATVRPEQAKPTGYPAVAGLAAAAVYAILPGAWYYSHTFMPDTAMVFFLTAALYAGARWIVDDGAGWRGWWPAALLLALAFLAKPVAVTAAIPLAAAALAHFGWRGALRRPQLWALFAAAFVPLALYDHAVVSARRVALGQRHHAAARHPRPDGGADLAARVRCTRRSRSATRSSMLATTMLGPGRVRSAAVVAFCVPLRSRSDALVWGWLGGGLLYAYVVVTVERVDYYLYLLLPLAALVIGRLCAFAAERLGDAAAAPHDPGRAGRRGLAGWRSAWATARSRRTTAGAGSTTCAPRRSTRRSRPGR